MQRRPMPMQPPKNREDVDGTTAAKEAAAKAEEEARQQALYDSMEEEEPYEPEIKCTGEGENQTCVEVICDESGNCSEARLEPMLIR